MLLECPGLRPLFGTLHCQRHLPLLFFSVASSETLSNTMPYQHELFPSVVCAVDAVFLLPCCFFSVLQTHFALLNKSGIPCLFSDPVPCYSLGFSLIIVYAYRKFPFSCLTFILIRLFRLQSILDNVHVSMLVCSSQIIFSLVSSKTKLNCETPCRMVEKLFRRVDVRLNTSS